eukprot:358087-Chlamydomonas_euryale.AAC.4
MPRRCGDASDLARLAYRLALRGLLQHSGRCRAPSAKRQTPDKRQAASDTHAPAFMRPCRRPSVSPLTAGREQSLPRLILRTKAYCGRMRSVACTKQIC